jgi:hypothetical protein
MNGSPYFRITGMTLTSQFLIVSGKNKQLFKIRFHPEKPDELGKISLLVQPCHQGAITSIACCLKMQVVFTASADKSIARWRYSIAGPLTLDFQQDMGDEVIALDLHPSSMFLVVSYNSHL